MDRANVISLRLIKAKAFLSEVELLVEKKFYSTSIHSLYLGCYHASSALLISNGVIPKNQRNIPSLLHQQFIEKGLFDQEKAVFFKKLMKRRIEVDHEDEMVATEEDVKLYVEPAKEYVSCIENLLRDYKE